LREEAAKLTDLQSTTLKNSSSHTHKMKQCAKGISEICIDSYGDIFTCDAFLAYERSVRQGFAFDNIHHPSFDPEKYRK
jgi:hypothetical protein